MLRVLAAANTRYMYGSSQFTLVHAAGSGEKTLRVLAAANMRYDSNQYAL